jgi:hypothetical protein
LGIDGKELVVVFMQKRGVTGDDGPVNFQPKDTTFKQGCIGGRKALGCRGDTVLGDESKDCLLGEDHRESKGAEAVRRRKTDTKYLE